MTAYTLAFVGGILGCEQESDGTVRPLVGWAVGDEPDSSAAIFEKLNRRSIPTPVGIRDLRNHWKTLGGHSLSGELFRFYTRCGKVDSLRIRPGTIEILPGDSCSYIADAPTRPAFHVEDGENNPLLRSNVRIGRIKSRFRRGWDDLAYQNLAVSRFGSTQLWRVSRKYGRSQFLAGDFDEFLEIIGDALK